MSSQRIWKKGNDYSHYEYLAKPRTTTSEKKITQVRDEIPLREFIDSTYNQQPLHASHRNPGQILRSVESKTVETNDFKEAFNISNERSPNYLDESVRFDRGIGFEPRVIHVNSDTEAHNSKRRRVEELAPMSSEIYRQHNDRLHPDRAVLVPIGRDDRWSGSHEQLSPATPLSTMNPFIRRNPNVYARSVDAMRHADREMIPRAVPYEASGPSRGPVRAFGSAETLHLSSHSVCNVPAGSQQAGHDSLFSTFEAPGKASLIPSLRDEHMRLQSSHVPFTSINSPCDAYDHLPCEFSNRSLINPLERRAVGGQQYEQELQSDFARLDTGSRYDSGNYKPSFGGLETHRATLVGTGCDRAHTPFRGEARTGVFLRKLPDENNTTPDNARLRSSRSRLIHKPNISPCSNSDNFLPFAAGSRDSQTWTPVREKTQVNLWQPTSRIANDQRYVMFAYSLRLNLE